MADSGPGRGLGQTPRKAFKSKRRQNREEEALPGPQGGAQSLRWDDGDRWEVMNYAQGHERERVLTRETTN